MNIYIPTIIITIAHILYYVTIILFSCTDPVRDGTMFMRIYGSHIRKVTHTTYDSSGKVIVPWSVWFMNSKRWHMIKRIGEYVGLVTFGASALIVLLDIGIGWFTLKTILLFLMGLELWHFVYGWFCYDDVWRAESLLHFWKIENRQLRVAVRIGLWMFILFSMVVVH